MASVARSQNNPVDMTPNEFVAMRGNVSNELQNIFGGGAQQYEGPFTAPASDAEMNQLSVLNSMARGGGSLESLIGSELEKTISGGYADPESNPYLRSTADAAKRGLTESLDQADLENRALFSRAGHKIQESSPFSTAQSLLGRSYANAVGDVETKIYGDNLQQERDRMQMATQMGTEFEQMRFVRGLDNLKAQELPRLIADLGIERGISQYNEFMEDVMEALGLATSAASPTLGQEGSSTQVGIVSS